MSHSHFAGAHAMNKVTLMFTPTWAKRDFPIDVEKFNRCFSSREKNFSWYPLPILWFDRLGNFVILSVSGDPTRACLLQVRLLAGAELKSPSGDPTAPQCPNSTSEWIQIAKEHLSQTFPAATEWAALVATPPYSFQLKDCICLCAPTAGRARGDSTGDQRWVCCMAPTNQHPPQRDMTGLAQQELCNSSADQPVNQLTQSTQPKGHQRLFKAILGSSEQVTSGTSPSFIHEHKVSTNLQDLPAERLEEAYGRRNSLHLQSRTE